MRIGRAVLFSAIIASLILSPAGAHWLGEKGKEGTHQEGHQQENAESGEQQAVEDLTGEERAKAYFTDLTLLDQDGKEVRFYSDVKLKEVEKIIDKRMGKDIFFVLISVDPKNDTVEAVKKYQEDHGVEGGWIFLTGKKSNLDHITQKLGQYQQKKETHSTLFLVGNVKTKHWAKVQPIYPSAGIAQKLKELAAES
jgi:hypothetical protein